MIHIGT